MACKPLTYDSHAAFAVARSGAGAPADAPAAAEGVGVGLAGPPTVATTGLREGDAAGGGAEPPQAMSPGRAAPSRQSDPTPARRLITRASPVVAGSRPG